ncbi:neutrophilic granule protein-like [Spea bombifrons]|uniref:neutrophilic granule protein-like n=1 Tax=Spea bombifrons TaxID=233779 RepID=UPI00234BFBAC|nr:neutrophilic granule protein-like [Spea bombifrons]
MEYTLGLLLLVCLPPAGNPASLGADGGEDLTEIINDLIESYNKEFTKTSLFTLLRAEEKSAAGDATKPPETIILIQETVCSASTYTALKDCPFKHGGEVRKCRISMDRNKTFTMRCEDPPGLDDEARNQVSTVEDVAQTDMMYKMLDVDGMKVPKIECLECIFTRLPG